MAKTKFFRVAVEGATATDGRTIERSWLQDIADNYNPQTYGARVNMEHIRGFSPAAPFNAYGDVLSVKAEEVIIKLNGKDEKRLALFAEIDPTDDLVKLTKARQKIYTSIEVQPNFANTGKAGLVGLAVTDSPASLGTDILQFSAKPENAVMKKLLDDRKQDPGNIFSAAEETTIELQDEAVDKGDSALERFAALLLNGLKLKEEPKPEPKAPDQAAPQTSDFNTVIAGMMTAISADRKADRDAVDDKFAKLTQSIETLQTSISTTPKHNHSQRPASTGGEASDRVRADY
ncbi:GPO family capsid scaffolding protein [Brevundimonas nasdae]|uniref:GPO family capsid scaffolding protein n=1 Tax=Brevundimonas nasdae TaxID=172043 RepID=UPI003F68F0D5